MDLECLIFHLSGESSNEVIAVDKTLAAPVKMLKDVVNLSIGNTLDEVLDHYAEISHLHLSPLLVLAKLVENKVRASLALGDDR